ncbi:MAG TPA: thymidine phosphorylase, partial [Sandaracinaceae bacterium]
IESGEAAARMRAIVEAQGGDPRVVDEPDRLPRAPEVVPVRATKSGFVHRIDALELGLTGVALGAGRTRADQDVDPAVGIVLEKVRGDRVSEGDVLAELHVRDRAAAQAFVARVAAAFELKPKAPKVEALVLDVIRR